MSKKGYDITPETPLINVVQMLHGVLSKEIAADDTASLTLIVRRMPSDHWLAHSPKDRVFRVEVKMKTRAGIIERNYVSRSDFIFDKLCAEITIENICECLNDRRSFSQFEPGTNARAIAIMEGRLRYLESIEKGYREEISRLKWEAEEAQRSIEDEQSASSFWENKHNYLLHIAHGYCSASTCGQDIEGS